MSERDSGSHEPRLGYCEVCDVRAAKYTCPKCELKTCSVECVKVHKTELRCDGVRDRTKFIRIKDFTDRDYFQDYQMLEECARFVFAVKRDEKKKYTRIDKELPTHLFRLKMAARERGVALQFLAQNFSRHRSNTTRYDYKTNLISWRVEWIFANAEPVVNMVDQKCLENVKLAVLLNKYLGDDSSFEGASALAPYRGVGFPGIKVLMKAEKLKGCGHKYFDLDLDESLAECLSGKCVVEFPTFVVVYKDHAYNFDSVIDNDVVTIEAKLENSFLECIKFIKLFNDLTSSDTVDARMRKQQYIDSIVSLTKLALKHSDSGSQEETENCPNISATAPQVSSIATQTAFSGPDSSERSSSGLDDSKTALETSNNLNSLIFKQLTRSMKAFTELQALTFHTKVMQLVTEMKYGPQTHLAPSTSQRANQSHTWNLVPVDFDTQYPQYSQQNDFDSAS